MAAFSLVIFAPVPVGGGVSGDGLSATARYGICGLAAACSLVLSAQALGQPLSRARLCLWAATELALAVSCVLALLSGFLQASSAAGVSVLTLAAVLAAMAGIHIWCAAHNGTDRRKGSAVGKTVGDTLGAIGRSWLALKGWVKTWLFVLNGVFLAGIALLRVDPAVKLALFAYVATAPYLVVLMLMQRGLSRGLGVAHIVPWTPLVAYLAIRLSADTYLGPRLTAEAQPVLLGYVAMLLGCIAVCLAFDYYDVVRWLRGERYLMGDEEAYRSGASRRALPADDRAQPVSPKPVRSVGN